MDETSVTPKNVASVDVASEDSHQNITGQNVEGNKPLAIAIMGPTASGKTALGIALAQHFATEIISVDSALVFRGMDIGSAKPCAQEQALAPHRLIDLCDPSETYSAARFCKDAEREIDALCAQGKTPLLVGGTMMYFKALLDGLSDMPATDPQTRAQVDAEALAVGWPAMHEQLKVIDPECAAALHPNHSQRIGRAIEVYRISGKTMTQWRSEGSHGLRERFNWVQIAIAPRDRGVLHERIERRFEQMLEQGFIEEVTSLYTRGDLHQDMSSIRAVGYRQVWEYLSGKISYAEMKEKGTAATRQLAKRQLTWLRTWRDLCWLYTQDETGMTLTSQQIVNNALNSLPKRPI